jgi:iron complex outermembrane receptor protein
MLLLAIAPRAATAEPVSDEEGYETIVTTSADEREGPSVEEIDRRELERKGARTAAEALETEPAVHAASGSRGERIFTLRGFDQRQVVVLVDGSPYYIPYDGQVDLNMVPSELIDRITVVKGPGSVLYGPNGMGGAINIVTRKPGVGPLAELRVETGRGDAFELRGLHTLRIGPLAYTIHGGLQRREAFPLSSRFDPSPTENGALRQNSDRRAAHLGARARLLLGADHALTTGITYVDASRGLPPSTVSTDPRFWRFTTWHSLKVSLGHHGQYLDGDLELDELVHLSLFDNLLDGFDDASYSTQASPRAFSSWYHDRIYGGRIRARYRLERAPWGPTELRLWLGAQHDRHAREDLQGDYPPHTRNILTFTPEAQSHLGGSQRWQATLGFQTDLELPGSGMRTQLGLGPLLSLRFDPVLNRLWLRATAARRTRFPSLHERFSATGTYRLPNPDLHPEHAWHLGLDASWRAARWLTLQVAAFDAELDGLIERRQIGGNREQIQNVGSARLLGVELALSAAPLRWLTAALGYTWVHARRTDAVAAEEEELQYRPAHKASLDLVLAPWSVLELSSQLHLVGPQRFQHPDTLRWGTLGTYLRWDARLDLHPFPWGSLWISVRNLLDSNYQTKLGFPDPGLELWAGLRLTVDRSR